MLHLRRLTYFLAVLDQGTLMAAADALHVAQPALSRQIRTLEEELGLHLFDRERGRLRPTPTAHRLEIIARTLLDQAHLAERATLSLRAGSLEQLVCATTRATAESLLAPFIQALDPTSPIVVCREVEHGEVEGALFTGADLAITPSPPSAAVASLQLGSFPVLAATHPAHHIAQASPASVPIAQLANELLILPPPTSMSRQELDRAYRRDGLPLGRHVVESSDSTSRALAASQRGVLITTSVMEAPLWVAPVTTADGSELRLSLYACWQREHYAAPQLATLATELSQFMRKQHHPWHN
ncbi:LysR family transcriptional regulator [Leucobacter sp. G161]|uniref:LysR family transcriptional regulator n=1 Tax=Leucobacter sp. G161 TaxID=663704 RepID=UPI00073B8E7C|nr:LysR family transcriptional regulator [Leucobacter sp. G161]KUF07474.1 hypothetical protein AUL38_08565 [Leucobacter sp. G161]